MDRQGEQEEMMCRRNDGAAECTRRGLCEGQGKCVKTVMCSFVCRFRCERWRGPAKYRTKKRGVTKEWTKFVLS